MTEPPLIDAKTLQLIESLFDSLPQDFEQAETRLRAIDHAYRSVLAKTLEPRLLDHMRSKNPADVDEYKAVSDHVGRLLRNLNLCATNRGKPAFLVGELAMPSYPTSARFALLRPDVSRRNRHVDASGDPIPLNLAPASHEAMRRIERHRRRLDDERSR